MPVFRAMRKYVVHEAVEVVASSKSEALDKFNEDHEDVVVKSEIDGDYECDFRDIEEVRGPFGTIIP